MRSESDHLEPSVQDDGLTAFAGGPLRKERLHQPLFSFVRRLFLSTSSGSGSAPRTQTMRRSRAAALTSTRAFHYRGRH